MSDNTVLCRQMVLVWGTRLDLFILYFHTAASESRDQDTLIWCPIFTEMIYLIDLFCGFY